MRKKKKLRTFAAFMAAVIICASAVGAVFAQNGDTANTVTYNAKNEVTGGDDSYEPTREGYVFAGWASTKAKADAGTVDFSPLPHDLSNADLNSIKNGETKRLYAVWEPLQPKYAVSVYGINADGANTITFGPATGGNYVKTSKPAHIEKSKETASDMCIHNHTWDEIIAQIKKDPTVFENCVANGCTASVKLKPTNALKSANWTDANMNAETGDGPSQLRNELNSNYRKWNNVYSNAGGWPASRIRAVLNGYDASTNISVAGSDITSINASNCLLSWFPEELQQAIVPKAVKSDTKYNDLSGNSVTTNDKLWIFSGKEIYGDSGSNNDAIRLNEGNLYDRASKMNITTSAYSGNVGYYVDWSSGRTSNWWLRSLYRGGSSYVCGVYGNGSWGRNGANDIDGIAPGFVVG